MYKRNIDLSLIASELIFSGDSGARKSSINPTADHLKGLRAFKEESRARCHIMISQVDRARRAEARIYILPWQEFLTQL